MRPTMFRSIAAASVAFAAACSSTDAVAPATAPELASRTIANAESVTPISAPIDQYVWVSCTNGGAGESVRVTGELRYDVQSTRDSSGVYHLGIKSNTLGLTAVGQTSGTVFRGMMTERVNSRAEDYLNMDVRIADMIRFAAPGSGESYALIATSHFIVDEGNYVLWDQTWSEVCR